METLNLNKIPSGSNPVVHCSQYDVGRVFRFNLFEGSEVVTLDGTETIECNVRKLDGTIVTVAVTNTSDSYVDVVTTEQMTAVHGSNYGEIVFKKGSDVIGTVNFILQVEKSPLEGGITSDSSIYNLETQIMDIVSVQYDSANVIFDNEGTSGHGIPYTVTSEGIKTMVDDAIALIPEELNDLSDVTTTTPASGETLVWDGSKWVNGTPTLDVGDLADTDINNPTNGEILVYNNGSWENQANPASTTNFAPDYDDTATYNTNDKVIYQGLLYVCLEDSVTGAWDSTKWQQISVADFTADLLPIESGSSTNTKEFIDSVVESGSNANGYYVKYKDGTMICTKVQTRGLQPADWNAWGSCYDSEILDLGSWSNTFYSAPVVNVNSSGAGAWIENVWDMSTTACGKLRLVRPSIPGGGITINFQIIGVGRWKA